MNDEGQVRELLAKAAELPDDIDPPVTRLLARARQSRARRAVTAAVSAATVMILVGALALPRLLHDRGRGTESAPSIAPGPSSAVQPLSGPDAANLARFHWSALARSPLGTVDQPVLAWTGRELVEFGWPRQGGTPYQGAAFVPATGRWHLIAPIRTNVGFSGAVSVWTGNQLFVTNGQFAKCATLPGRKPSLQNPCLPQAGLYDPATNGWSTTQLPMELDRLALQSAVWTGRQVVVTAVGSTSGKLVVAAYDPATRHWTDITPALPAGHPARFAAMVAVPGRVILWSFWDVVRTHRKCTKKSPGGASSCRVTSASDRAGVDVLALGSSGGWRDVTGSWPQNQDAGTPVYTGRAILLPSPQIWCGMICSPPGPGSSPGFFASPATLARTPIPAGPLSQANPSYIWTGRSIIAVNLDDSESGPHIHIRPDDMAVWDAVTGWHRLAAPPGYPSLAATPVWAGSELLALAQDGTLQALRH
jgi:hypothetical protein